MSPTRSWIYYLTKDQIVKELERLGIDNKDNTASLRHRLFCIPAPRILLHEYP